MNPKLTISKFGSKYWYLNGELHRTDGPAVIYYDGLKFWYLNDKEYPKKTWINLILSRYLK